MAGYFVFHAFSTSSNSISACSLLLAVYTFYKQLIIALKSLYATYLVLFRIWCITQSCNSALGKMLSMASAKPFRLSIQAMSISFTPLFCKSVSTYNQNLAPSVSLIYKPNTSLVPSLLTPIKQFTALIFMLLPSLLYNEWHPSIQTDKCFLIDDFAML
jgi:hypothetical protein